MYAAAIRHAVIIGVAGEAIGMHRETALPGFQHGRGTALFFSAADTRFNRTADTINRGARHAVIDHVHHPAHRRAAVQQRGRTAQHFDTIDHQRIQRDRVIGAEAGGVKRGALIAEDANAVAV